MRTERSWRSLRKAQPAAVLVARNAGSQFLDAAKNCSERSAEFARGSRHMARAALASKKRTRSVVATSELEQATHAITPERSNQSPARRARDETISRATSPEHIEFSSLRDRWHRHHRLSERVPSCYSNAATHLDERSARSKNNQLINANTTKHQRKHNTPDWTFRSLRPP